MDFFRHEYEVKLRLGGTGSSGVSGQILQGVDALIPEGNGAFRMNSAEKAFCLLRDLSPRVIRFGAEDPDAESWIDFCRRENIAPHLVFRLDADPETLRKTVEACLSVFPGNGERENTRFYEVECTLSAVDFSDGSLLNEAAEKMGKSAQLLRMLDPSAKIILGGIAPLGSDCGRADAWNERLLRKNAGVMDAIGVSLCAPVNGRNWDENAEGIEVGSALAAEILSALKRLEYTLGENDRDRRIKAAVTGWAFIRDSVPQKRQDCVYYAAVSAALRMFPDLLMICDAGPLFGPDGLLEFENGNVYCNVFYHILRMTAQDLPQRLEIMTPENLKTVPVYHWQGLPGMFGPAEIPLLDAFASEDPESSRIFLCITNRSAFLRAVPRIQYRGIPELQPLSALSLRSADRMDFNSAGDPDRVYCKEIKLKNYRRTDHVTLDIPPCSTICMVLEKH